MAESFYHGGGDIGLDFYPETTPKFHKVQVSWPTAPGDPPDVTTVYLNPNLLSDGPHDVRDYDKPSGWVTVTFQKSDTGVGGWSSPSATGQVTTTDRRVWAESDDLPPSEPDKNDANVVVT